MRIYKLLFSFIILAIPLLLVSPVKAASSVQPIPHSGNPSCTDLGYDYGKKYDVPGGTKLSDGTYDLQGLIVEIKSDGTFIDWETKIPVDAVLVKGGPNANEYKYDPAELSGEGLRSPDHPNPGKIPGISHIDFCFYHRLEVSKTVNTFYQRLWTWEIEKTADEEELDLKLGDKEFVNYLVKLSSTYADSKHRVWGIITIYNPSKENSALLLSVVGVISENIPAKVTCGDMKLDGNNLNYCELEKESTLICKYFVALGDDSPRVNTATVTVAQESKVKGSSTEEEVVFGEPSKVIDECVTLSDDKYNGTFDELCVDEEQLVEGLFEKEISYELELEGNICGPEEFVNTATFTTVDRAKTGSSSATVLIDTECVLACTLTQGYWKTHSIYGPAPYDETWKQVGEDKNFFNSGKTYIEVMWTPPAGSVYYNLAHQYIAAVLNSQKGDVPKEVQDALDDAYNLFNDPSNTPQAVLKLKGNNLTRAKFVSLAGILGSYNEGKMGVNHCDEDVKVL